MPRRPHQHLLTSLAVILGSLVATAGVTAAQRRSPRRLNLVAPSDASGRLDAAGLQALGLQVATALGRRYHLVGPCTSTTCPRTDHLTTRVVADGPSCRLELLLIAPPLLPRRVVSLSAACTGPALRAPLEEALRRLLPRGGGEAESAPRHPHSRRPTSHGELPTGVEPSAAQPASAPAPAPRRRAAPSPAQAAHDAFFRDRAVLAFGLALLSRHASVTPSSGASSVDPGPVGALHLAIEVYPAAGRDDAWADLGFELRYGRAFSRATPTGGDEDTELQWIEAGARFRWNPRRQLGGPELAGAFGWGYHASRQLLKLDAHYLRLGGTAYYPLRRQRSYSFGLRADAALLVFLPVVDVASAAVGLDVRAGLAFSSWGIHVRLEGVLRSLAVDVPDPHPSAAPSSSASAPYRERNVGGLLSVGYAL